MNKSQTNIYLKMKEAAESIQKRFPIKPEIGLILGSGLGALAESVTDPVVISYSDIPNFHNTSIEGHAGKMVLGKLDGVPVAILQGRFHVYEGYDMEDVVFPTRTLCALGIHTLVVTNAAGAVNTKFRPGDLMVIEDHLNLMGNNPLRGPNHSQLGPRFPDLTEAYSRICIDVITETARELDIVLQQGVYAGLLGPTYETPAEVRMLRTLGADAVGMSTVPESIAANHLGVRVTGISCITNLAAGLSPNKLSHQEVIENSAMGVEKMKKLIAAVVPKLVYKPKEVV